VWCEPLCSNATHVRDRPADLPEVFEKHAVFHQPNQPKMLLMVMFWPNARNANPTLTNNAWTSVDGLLTKCTP